jgi:DNA modification methylase
VTVRLVNADCVEAMARMEPEAVDAIVCDPPYGLEFMGKEWDKFGVGKQPQIGKPDGSKFRQNRGTPSYTDDGNPTCRNCHGDKYRNGPRKCRCDHPDFGNPVASALNAFQAWSQQWAEQAFRVLKPGGHLLAFGGTRTYHRLACAVEDAGFELRDCIMWLYGSGFPKSMDVGKAIDRAAGAEREVVGQRADGRYAYEFSEAASRSAGIMGEPVVQESRGVVTAPATPEAEQWQGWGTALKPAYEPVVVARKPLIGSVATNVLRYGTGGLNVDGCRVGYAGEQIDFSRQERRQQVSPDGTVSQNAFGADGLIGKELPLFNAAGRWPANVVLSHTDRCVRVGERAYECAEGCPVKALDDQSGDLGVSQGGRIGRKPDGWFRYLPSGTYGAGDPGYGDEGGASRFFNTFEPDLEVPFYYCAKAGTAEREAGLDALPTRDFAQSTGAQHAIECGEDEYQALDEASNGLNVVKRRKNVHPTVKPLELMRHLVRLVTPPGGTVLDPFMGSGSTGIAAVLEGMSFIGVENDTEHGYFELARARLSHAERRVALCYTSFVDDAPVPDGQLSLLDGLV